MPSFITPITGDDALAEHVAQITENLQGLRNIPLSVSGINDAAAYALTVKNAGTGSKDSIMYAANGTTVLLQVDGSGVLASRSGAAAEPILTTGSTISSDMLADNAATTATIHGFIGGPSTTSTTAVDLTGAVTTLDTDEGVIFIWLAGAFYASAVGATVSLYVKTDAEAYPATPIIRWQQPSVGTQVVPVCAVFHTSALTPGDHTFQVGWSVSTGTVTLDSGCAFTLDAAEFKH